MIMHAPAPRVFRVGLSAHPGPTACPPCRIGAVRPGCMIMRAVMAEQRRFGPDRAGLGKG
jgi:hypothetical protein